MNITLNNRLEYFYAFYSNIFSKIDTYIGNFFTSLFKTLAKITLIPLFYLVLIIISILFFLMLASISVLYPTHYNKMAETNFNSFYKTYSYMLLLNNTISKIKTRHKIAFIFLLPLTPLYLLFKYDFKRASGIMENIKNNEIHISGVTTLSVEEVMENRSSAYEFMF